MSSVINQPSVMTALASQMRAAIDSGKTTITKMADDTGLSRPQLYRIMDGVTESPSIRNAEAIAEHLGFELVLKVAKRRPAAHGK